MLEEDDIDTDTLTLYDSVPEVELDEVVELLDELLTLVDDDENEQLLEV